ncbi:metal-sulfur cluster assembly factor [Paenirhodobacter sp.]|uniref:metal-sulfur cluster assembly factor n=1 Tax=Paenirhodobacter sp. TaxID=1965326 RepID=UPI003B40C28C
MDDTLRARVDAALERVSDPETGLSLPAMGLIYGIEVAGDAVAVVMTTTTRGCPLTAMLAEGVRETLRAVPGVGAVDVRLTWDPPWDISRMRG